MSVYGFTGEAADPSGLVYLRARYYSPATGRFMSRDPWEGDANMPMTYNVWLYTYSNPINLLDPSGMITQGPEAGTAAGIVDDLKKHYDIHIKKDWGETCGVWIPGRWGMGELRTVYAAVSNLASVMGGPSEFRSKFHRITISFVPNACGRGCTNFWGNKISFKDRGLLTATVDVTSNNNIDKWTVIHELGHAWDFQQDRILSRHLEQFTGGRTNLLKRFPTGCDTENRLPGCNHAGYFYGDIPPKGSDKNFNRYEDFAESLAAYVYPDEAHQYLLNNGWATDPTYNSFLYNSTFSLTLRWDYIDQLVQ